MQGVDDVLGRMSGEVSDIQQAYDRELLTIDAAFGQALTLAVCAPGRCR